MCPSSVDPHCKSLQWGSSENSLTLSANRVLLREGPRSRGRGWNLGSRVAFQFSCSGCNDLSGIISPLSFNFLLTQKTNTSFLYPSADGGQLTDVPEALEAGSLLFQPQLFLSTGSLELSAAQVKIAFYLSLPSVQIIRAKISNA